ncbi:MAG: TonB-dependent receptor [Acidobacteria bacterium]|nr:TonB-dependent receptor [Acidobacteriota bacterium]
MITRHSIAPHSNIFRLGALFICLCAAMAFGIDNAPLHAASAQGAVATLSGIVVDEKDAVVAEVEVTIINPSTGLRRTVKTNSAGIYSFPALAPGSYNVTTMKDGFAPREVRDIVLNANDQRSLRIQLKIGAVGDVVTITDQVGTVKDDGAVATVVDSQFVSNLPLNGRSLQTLISLAPGVVTTGATSQNPGQFSVNGLRSNTNYFTVDGVSANFGTNNFAGYNPAVAGAVPATSMQGSFANLASIDALQEFKIQTSTFAPEFGRSPGAQVSLVTRSGENRYRGTVYNYFRNDALDANDYFNNLNRIKKQPLRYNNFGGTFSGPIRLPEKIFGPASYDGRDRTFFFFSYEGQRFLLPRGAVLTVVPSVAARSGAPNEIARQVLNAFPLPNGADIVNASGALTGGANFISAYSEPSASNATSMRLDHNFNQKFNIFGRYNYAPSRQESRNQRNLSQINRLQTRTETFTLGSTQVFGARLVNEVRVNWSQQDGTSQQVFDGFGGGVEPPEAVLFPSTVLNGPRRGIITIQGLSLVQGNPFTDLSIGTEELFRQRQINVVDNLTYTRGAHQLKFGADYRWLSPVIAPAGFVSNSTFANVAGVYNNTAASVFALRGIGYTLQFPSHSFYAQDTWRISPRLTLTYGTRWDINPAPTARGSNQVLTVKEIRDLNAADFSYLELAPLGTPQYPTGYGNFGPRVGVAYQLAGQTGRELMLRGGFGLFYDLGQNGFGAVGFPYSASRSTANVPVPLAPSVAEFPAPNFNLSPTNRASVTVADPNLHLPRVYQWNVTLEQSLGQAQTISAAYVASAARGLLRTTHFSFLVAQDPANPTRPFSPNFSTMIVRGNGSTSDYQSLQVQFNRRLSRGLQTIASYTWSHAIDSGSADLDRGVPGSIVDTIIDRASSDFDVRHSFSTAVTYNIPTPKWGAAAEAVLRNWAVNSVIFARTSTPVNVIAEEQQSTNLFRVLFSRRPDVVPGVPFYVDDSAAPGGKRINPAAFAFPSAARAQGALPRNALRGFGAWQADTGVHRQFNLTETLNIQFRAEVFNIFNNPNFSNPGAPFPNVNLAFASATPGSIAIDNARMRSVQMLNRGLGGGGNSGGFNPIFQVGGPRSLQFALRIQF